MLGAGETVIGQTNKLGADINARGLYRLVGDGSRDREARRRDRRAAPAGLDPTAICCAPLRAWIGLHRAAFAQFRRAAAAGLDDRAPLYRNARRAGRARPPDLARSQGLVPIISSTRMARSTAWSMKSKRAWHAGKSRWRGITRRQFGERRDRDRQSRSRVRLSRRSPTSRSRRSSRWSPTSRSGTGSAAAMSSAIPTSRRRARKTRASCFPGRRSPSAGSRCRVRRATSSTHIGPTPVSCWRSSGSAMT